MTEIRCVKCRRLLFKVESAQPDSWVNYHIEIKCPKCGYKNHNTMLKSPPMQFDLSKESVYEHDLRIAKEMGLPLIEVRR